MVFIPEGAEPKGETAQPRGVVGREVGLVPCPGNPGLVLEAIQVISASGLSLFLCYFAEWLRGHVLGEGTCHSGTVGTRDRT